MKTVTKLKESIYPLLCNIYTDKESKKFLKDLNKLFETYSSYSDKKRKQITEKDAVLITYADSVISDKKAPLSILNDFLRKTELYKSMNIVHILPFYPWDTDRGFSVVDYYKVFKENGTWEGISKLSEYIDLMFDFVANHASIENPLIKKTD